MLDTDAIFGWINGNVSEISWAHKLNTNDLRESYTNAWCHILFPVIIPSNMTDTVFTVSVTPNGGVLYITVV